MSRQLAKVQFILLCLALYYCKRTAKASNIPATALGATEIFLQSAQPTPETFKISAAKNSKVTTKHGTAIRIPKNTFQSAGKLTIKVTETLTPAEGASLKVPMRDDKGRTFQSDGMFRLDTDAKLIGKSKIRFSMIAQSTKPMNVYSWRGGKWVFEGKNQLVPSETDDDNIRSYTGVEPNVLYNYDLPIEPQDESCVIIKVPTVQEHMSLLLFENDGRSTTSELASHSDNIGISFSRGTSVKLRLWGDNGEFWEKTDYRMPQTTGELSAPRTCETLTAFLTAVPAMQLPAPVSLTLQDIKAKYGRIARIETKNGRVYEGYFNQMGAHMTVQTVSGQVLIPIANVQKITPMN